MEKISEIRKKIQERREKSSITRGCILYIENEEENKFEFCVAISKDEYIIFKDLDFYSKVVKEKIYTTTDYKIAYVSNEKFILNEQYLKKIEDSLDEIYFLKIKCANSIDFLAKKLDSNTSIKQFKKMKLFLKKNFNINKWKSSYTDLFIKNLDEKIEEKKEKLNLKENINKEFPKLEEKYKSEYFENDIEKYKLFENLNELEFIEKLEIDELKKEKFIEEKLKNLINSEDFNSLKEELEEKYKHKSFESDKVSGIDKLKNMTNSEDFNSLKEELEEKYKHKSFESDKASGIDKLKNMTNSEDFNSLKGKLKEKYNEILKEKKVDEKFLGLLELKNLIKYKEKLENKKSSNIKKIEEKINEFEKELLDCKEFKEEYKKELEYLNDLKLEIQDENIPDKDRIIKLLLKILNLGKEIEKNESYLSGWGLSIKELSKMNSNFFKYLKLYDNNKELEKIINKIGREKGKEQKASQEIEIEKFINEYSKNEVFGVEKGNDISRILPSELSYLMNEETEYIFYSKFLEKNLLCYKLIGKESSNKPKEKILKEKGAIIALVDTSGSMGYRLEKARAILIKTLQIAKKDNRDMKVILFGSIGQKIIYETDDKYNINKFIDFISNAYNGGTDYETPLMEAINIINKDKKYGFADIFLLTDGMCQLSNSSSMNIKKIKKDKDLKIYTVIIDGYSSGVDNFSDEILNC